MNLKTQQQFVCPLITMVLSCLAFSPLYGAVQPQAHYNLKGAGGIRDTACPERLVDQTGKSPDLTRHGFPKVMSNAPETRRQEYDSSIKFEDPEQCYSTPANLVKGDNFVLETWVYALKENAAGWHSVVANGHGGIGFLMAQNGGEWCVLVGGVGSRSLGKVEKEKWTHLAVVKSAGKVTGWMNGIKTANLPDLGGGAANFSIGATAPGKEPFNGWIAEVRYATFRPGKFDPGSDFLIDTRKLKVLQIENLAAQSARIKALIALPGVEKASILDEHATTQDWLLHPPTRPSFVQVQPAPDHQSAKIMMGNGLVSRTFLLRDNLSCISLRRSDKNLEFIRTTKPEARIRLNGRQWVDIGGLTGAPDRAFLTPAWFDELESRQASFRFSGMTVCGTIKPYDWQPKFNAPATPWPAAGKRVTFHFSPPEETGELKNVRVDIHYEIYDGLPVIMKTLTVHNSTGNPVILNQFEGEHLAVQPTLSRMLHVESDYSFAAANFNEQGSALGIHVSGGDPKFKDYSFGAGTTRFIRDPEWGSMATLNPAEDLFLNNPESALLLSRPTVGPNWTIKSGDKFEAFRTFEILNDTTERERFHLAQRRFYKKLAPQSTEHQFEVHAPYSRDLKTLAPLIDQMAEMGFEMLQAPEHPGEFNYADTSEANISSMKKVCDYAKSKGIGVGAYQLMMASQGWGSKSDNFNCINPASMQPGSLFGQSACGASAWADMYYSNMWITIERAGMSAFKPDGPYHGDPCAATNHPHHAGLEDSQWAQWKWMCKVLHEGQRRGLYLSIPDWYFLNGQCCTGMGYREATDNIDIVLQTVIYRQYIYDATWHKTAGMGWVNLNTEVLHGGMEKNLDQYERTFFIMLSSGAQVWLRGHRIYDGPQSKAMIRKWMDWYVQHREVIQGDIIHLRRPDGRGLDYYLHVNPSGKEKGMLLVFNPLPAPARQTLDVPLYYTGLTESARIHEKEGRSKTVKLDRDYHANVPVEVPANGYTWFIIE